MWEAAYCSWDPVLPEGQLLYMAFAIPVGIVQLNVLSVSGCGDALEEPLAAQGLSKWVNSYLVHRNLPVLPR